MNNQQTPMERYRKIYLYFNDKTLSIAAVEHPDLVIELINDTSIRGLARAYALTSLSNLTDIKYLDYIKSFAKDESPFMRESVFMGIAQYAIANDNQEHILSAIDFLQHYLKEENGDGVKKQILSQLELLQIYKD